jgi:SsrA-binding protein
MFKVNIGIAKGKKNYDKREDLKQKSIKRDIQRVMKEYR